MITCSLTLHNDINVMPPSLSSCFRCAQPTRGSDSSQGPAAAAANGEERRGKCLQPVWAPLHWTVFAGYKSGQHLWTQWVMWVWWEKSAWRSEWPSLTPPSIVTVPLSKVINHPTSSVELLTGHPVHVRWWFRQYCSSNDVATVVRKILFCSSIAMLLNTNRGPKYKIRCSEVTWI